MDKMSAPTKELAQRLYEKNAELDSRRRKSLQARIPSDPNIWQQMRENYETIILEDHAFSEQHNIEHALWQLHYKKIEELRAHHSAAQASVQGGKGPARPDRLAKIRLQFKTFLSEATGFYHDLILKTRAKYGLPLGYFSEDSENRIGLEKDVKKSAEMKKGLISCHRCLIYLGDLARYKGLYGEANAKPREYTAASGYYLQAASLWPSIGNPHHQLAILASYSGDDFLTVYRYFRSLAVDSPCSTARDNLVVAFEKNRQSYSQLPCDKKPSALRFSDKRRGREVRQASKESDAEAGSVKDKDKASSSLDAFKFFCIRFIRLNGILFTRTSLETFAEVLSLVSTGLHDLLSSAKEGDLKFGADVGENAVFFVRLVAILVFTVQNSKKENEGQTYAEIVQRAVLLQNAFSAAFEIVGLLLERCEQQPDPSSSYLLPGVLVFAEWLACCPDVASGSDADGKQAACRSAFWVHFISFANKLLSTSSISVEDNEETCFYNMSTYDEGETENRLALSEDFELRGFLPLVPAQTILDFSRKHSFGIADQKEQAARVKRILAAGKALLGVVKIDQKSVHYDSREKKFVVGVEPPQRTQNIDLPDNSVLPPSSATMLESNLEIPLNSGMLPPDSYLDMEDEEEEVILFRPTVSEKQADVDISSFLPATVIESVTSLTGNCKPIYGVSHSSTFPLDNLQHQAASDALLAKGAVIQNVSSALQHFMPTEVSPNWLLDENSTVVNSLRDLRLVGNGHVIKSEGQNIGNFQPTEFLEANPYSTIANSMGKFYTSSRAPEPVLPTPRIGAVTSFGISADNLVVKPSPSPLPGMKKNPVSRPVRHVGPPPGFGSVPKQANGSLPSLGVTSENPISDDYCWLDGYQMPPPLKSTGFSNSAAFLSHANSQYNSGSVGLTASAGFPFPGKQVPVAQLQFGGENGQTDHQKIDYMKLQEERQLLQANRMLNGNHNLSPQPEQYQETVWAGRYVV